ncbi:MAG: M20/M25/M40 family metallo-hydrolase [Firmicutes bacterium]|nr:M20/M25/M40 family metallo-hydrolase [Bacillota bacterium]
MRKTVLFTITIILAGLFFMNVNGFADAAEKIKSSSGAGAEVPDSGFLNEAVDIFRQYLAIDTTNPPGNEMKTALFLKKILDREGIENRIIDLGSNRANVFAVVRGNGELKPVVLFHHMDVVSADAGFWTHPPFEAQIANGMIYARGTMDIKGKGIVDLMTLIYIKRKDIKLKRDIIFLAVSDEESGSIGSKKMIGEYSYLIKNAEYLLDEGGSITCDDKGEITGVSVSIGEKTPLWLTLTFKGEPGHGSVPLPDSSVNKAVKAAGNIINRKPEFIILPELAGMVENAVGVKALEKIPGWKGNTEESLKNREFQAELAKDPEINAFMTNTIAVTMLKGSDKVNIIPNEASISLDCRLMPGTDKDGFIREIVKLSGDPGVKVSVDEYTPTLSSPADSAMVKAIAKSVSKKAPGVKTVPVLMFSSTDGSFYRSLGIKSYGFEPYKATKSQYNSAHGNDERIGVENFKFGIPLLLDILMELDK